MEQRDTAIWTDFSGRLEAMGRIQVRPLAAGTIMAAHFREGALVDQGDKLFTIDPAPYVAEVQRLEAQPTAAGARLVLAAREQQRGADINGGPAPGYSSGQAQDAVARVAAASLPKGFAFEWTDLTYQQILAGNSAVLVFPLALLLV